MRTFIIFLFGAVITLGCARVRVEAPKEPIRVDIAMRVDIYQHVQKDIDDIEDIVSGTKAPSKSPGPQTWLRLGPSPAYAEGELSAEIENAALRRKMRLPDLAAREARGSIGENNLGLLEARGPSDDPQTAELIRQENSDRMIIYEGVAQKNGTVVVDVQRVYAQRLQSDAPAGTPVQKSDGNWTKK